MDLETITYRRDELYDQVWKDPVRTVARAYDISDVWLAKICRKLSVPLPGRGYWARKRAGWEPNRLPLPPLPDGKPAEIAVPRRRQQVFLRRILRPEDGEQPPRPAPPVITVSETLERPHRLVAQAAKLLRGRGSADEFVSCWSVSCLKICVTKASLGRALRIMDALVRALEERGHRVEVTRALSYEERQRRTQEEVPDNATRVLISEEWIEFGISEKSTMVKTSADPPKGLRGDALQSWILSNRPTTRNVPSGVLELGIRNCDCIGIRTAWRDGKRQRLEQCLGSFVSYLLVAAEARKQDRLERERQHREWEEEQRRREEARARAQEEAEREKRLKDRLARWRLARDAREYVAEVRVLVAMAKAPIEDESVLHEWLKWIDSFAARIDPLGELRENAERAAPSDGLCQRVEEEAVSEGPAG